MAIIELLTPPAPAKRPRRTLTATETALRDIGRQFGRRGQGDRDIIIYAERGEHPRTGAAIATDSYSLAVFPTSSPQAVAIAATLDDGETPIGEGAWFSIRKNPHPTTGVIAARNATRPRTGAGLWNLFPAGPLEEIAQWCDVTDLLPSADQDPGSKILAGVTATGDTGVIVNSLVLKSAGAEQPDVRYSVRTAGDGSVNRVNEFSWARRPITLSTDDGTQIGLAMPLRHPDVDSCAAILARLRAQ